MSEDSGSREDVLDEIRRTLARYEARRTGPEPPTLPTSPSPAAKAAEEEAPAVVEGAPSIAPQIEIPPPSLVETGIPGLDAILGGGLPDHSLILVLGEPGSHYNTFVSQVLYNYVYEGGKVAYYVAETLNTDIMQDMSHFGWDLKEYLNRGSWVFVNLRTSDLQELAALSPRVFSQGFTISLTRGLNSLKTDLLTKIKEDRWTVLELSHILHHFNLDEVMSLILYWRMAMRLYGGLHFAVLPLGVHPENVLNALKHLADGVLEFRLREAPRAFDTLMIVQKLRGFRRPLLIAFTVEEDGIVIETAARIA